MCHPAVAAVIGIAGGVLQGVGAAGQKETNAQNYEMRAAGIGRDIKVERHATATEIAARRLEYGRVAGANRAGFAANGLALDGSATDLLASNATEADLDLAMIRYNSKNKIAGMKYEKKVNLWNAGQERGAKGLAFFGPILGSAAQFGGSFG